jgi:hypothetical protein
MDPVNFGRWIAESRRAAGWRSQRALIAALKRDLAAYPADISEDFLARLEAGQLAAPLRPAIRRRVLALAWMLCASPHDLRTFLRVAELTDLTAEEATTVRELNRYLTALAAPARVLLPPRPARLVGRGEELRALVTTMTHLESGVCAITGLPGVGKSALAYEVIHHVAGDERLRVRRFPDGVATFTCTGRAGVAGLLSLLDDITEAFTRSLIATRPGRRAPHGPLRRPPSAATPPADTSDDELGNAALADALDRARLALADKRCLLLLDDVPADFPVRQAVEALLTSERSAARAHAGEPVGCVVLVTSQHILPPAVVASHLRLSPLDPGAARQLFAALIGRSLMETEHDSVAHICALVGHLPLALELAATAVGLAGIPLTLLEHRLAEDPLGMGLRADAELRPRFARALAALAPEPRALLTLLAALGVSSFGLEAASAIAATRAEHSLAELTIPAPLEPQLASGAETPTAAHAEHLTQSASDLGQLVMHSLLDIAPPPPPTDTSDANGSDAEAPLDTGPHYLLHPVVRATLSEDVARLDPRTLRLARQGAWAYALAYVEESWDVERLAREREFLLAMTAQAWQHQQHGYTARLVARLSCFPGLLGTTADAERILRWGIQAYQQRQEWENAACLLDSLGTYHYFRGAADLARRVWEESVRLAESLQEASPCAWDALANLALLAALGEEHDTARSLLARYMRYAQDAHDARTIAFAWRERGTCALLASDREAAGQAFAESRVVVERERPFHTSLVADGVRAAQARLVDDLARARQATEAAVAVATRLRSPYVAVRLLVDQATYLHQRGEREEARALAGRAAAISADLGVSYLHAHAAPIAALLAQPATSAHG